jgi:hypothetical protein
MNKTSFPGLLAASCLLAATASAEVVHLADGKTLVGALLSEGKTFTVKTLDGVRTVNASEVVRVERKDALLTTYARLAAERQPEDGFGHLSVARWCREKGMFDEMWSSLERARKAKTGAAGLDDFLGELEAELLGPDRGAPAEKKVKELVHKAKGDGSARDRAIVAVLARMPGADAGLREEGRKHWRSEARKVAVEAVAERVRAKGKAAEQAGSPADKTFLFMRTVADASAPVRATSVREVRELGLAEAAVERIGPLTRHENDAVRMRAVEALGELGEPKGIEYLITALSGGAGASPRGHVAFLDYQTYIKDFEVEIAQAASIADPVVDTVMSGVVLDAQVKGVSWERIVVERVGIRKAIRKLGGDGLPEDPKQWAEWWAKRKQQEQR